MSNANKVKLKDVCELITKGTTPTSIGFNFTNEGINFIKIESINGNGTFNNNLFAHINNDCNNKLKRSQLKENDILFSIAGAIGRVAIVSKDILPANTNQALAIIRLKKDVNIKLTYLVKLLNSSYISKQYEKLKQGVAQLNLSLQNIGDFEIPVPPLAEQEEIVNKLDSIEKLISARKSELDKLDLLIKAKFNEMFGGETNLIKIKDVCTLINGKPFKPTDWTKSGLPIVRIQNLNNLNATFNYYDKDISKNYLIDNGNLLFSWSGTPGTSFGAFIWDRGKAVLNQHIFKVIPKVNSNIVFLKYSLNNKLDYIIDKAHGGVGLQHITKKDFDETYIVIPPIELQNQFADFVNKVNELKDKVNASLTSLTLLKKQQMQKYFG